CPGRLLDAPRRARSGGDRGGCGSTSAVGRDYWVPALAGGDDRVQVPQDRGGDDGLGLGRCQLVRLAGGQVLVAGAINRVGAMRRQGFCRPCLMIDRRMQTSNRAPPSRRVRARSPPSRSTTTVSAAIHVCERNGCCAVSSTAGQTHSSRSRICCTWPLMSLIS